MIRFCSPPCPLWDCTMVLNRMQNWNGFLWSTTGTRWQLFDLLVICHREKTLGVPLSKHRNWPNSDTGQVTSSQWPIGEQDIQLLLQYATLKGASSSYEHYMCCGTPGSLFFSATYLPECHIAPFPGSTWLTPPLITWFKNSSNFQTPFSSVQ